MQHLSLAARYRPQLFSDVAGQPLAAIALSRAAALDKVAPAYLLSGTRGVGKTTIARIFAKALNCEKGPAAEPCNECAQCRHITAGNHVDVNEIDGASNTGVDDVRTLRENIGFMPMEGRYKIFIVDEAHMLSKNAFNALLKTLEEPPGRTVFIFATTEAHRFPATIISRCQHFVFQHLPEQAIFEHLLKILGKEGVEYDEDAARIIAKRAAGSVRDSLSLLDQALSLNQGKLEASAVREALGVAGPELLGRLLDAIAHQDCSKILAISGQLLASGIDFGFFIKELSSTLRDLFLAAQTEGKILETLPLSRDEKVFIKTHAPLFSAAHLHAAWQMALDSQRGIAQSPEPGAAMELLLLNLALLPRLLPVGSPKIEAGINEAQSRSDPQKQWIVEDGSQAPYNANEANNALDKVSIGDLSNSDKADSEIKDTKPDKNWAGFCEFCRKELEIGNEAPSKDILASLIVDWKGDRLEIRVRGLQLWERFNKKRKEFEVALDRYCEGSRPEIICHKPDTPKSERDLVAEYAERPEVKLCREMLDARIIELVEKPGSGESNA